MGKSRTTITTSQPHQLKKGDRITITGIKRPWWLFWRRSMTVTITHVSGETVDISRPYPF
jgi:hypothetical protein